MNLDRISRHRVEHGFALGALILVFAALSAGLMLAPRAVDHSLQRRSRETAETMARMLSPLAEAALREPRSGAFRLAVDALAHDASVLYVRVERVGGEVLAASGRVPESDGLAALPAGLARPSSRALEAVRLSGGSSSVSVIEGLAPVRSGDAGGAPVMLRVGLSRVPVAAAVDRVRRGLWLSALVAATVALIGSRWIAGRTVRALRRLADGASAVARGDRAIRIPVVGAEELADLGAAFNKMIERLDQSEAESRAYRRQLQDLNAKLEREVAERTRELDESQAHYRTLVQQSPEAILILQENRLRFVNRTFCRVFGVPESDARAPGFRIEGLFEADSRPTLAAELEAWSAGRQPAPAELAARAADGSLRWFELRACPIEFGGRPALECLLLDVTEARRLREQLDDTERLRALGELANGVAHDFNNQLGAILGRVQLLRRRCELDGIDTDLAVIEDAAKAGRETVRRIQDVSRLRTDRPLQAVRLHDVLGQAVELTRSRWAAGPAGDDPRIDVRVEGDPALPPIRGNATELREVFANLICNAIDAMPGGGTLTLASRRSGDDLVRVEVRDTGVGMDEVTRRRLFDPFFTTKGSGGTGLGMSVAYGIVTRHRGSIAVDSEPGRGSRISLEFPVDEPIPEVRGGDGAAMPSLVRPGRILVIDDEAPIAQLVQDALSCDGHRVDVAGCGTQGVEMAARDSYDLVMTDLGMPDITGWEVARRIHDARPGLPVVLVTGWGTTLKPDEVERSGIAAVVQKPFEIKDLLETAQRILADREAGEDR